MQKNPAFWNFYRTRDCASEKIRDAERLSLIPALPNGKGGEPSASLAHEWVVANLEAELGEELDRTTA